MDWSINDMSFLKEKKKAQISVVAGQSNLAADPVKKIKIMKIRTTSYFKTLL